LSLGTDGCNVKRSLEKTADLLL